MIVLSIMLAVLITASAIGITYDRREVISAYLDKIIPLPEETKNERKIKSLRFKANELRKSIQDKNSEMQKAELEKTILSENLEFISKKIELIQTLELERGVSVE